MSDISDAVIDSAPCCTLLHPAPQPLMATRFPARRIKHLLTAARLRLGVVRRLAERDALASEVVLALGRPAGAIVEVLGRNDLVDF